MLDSCRVPGNWDHQLLAMAMAGDSEVSGLDRDRDDSRWRTNHNTRVFLYFGGADTWPEAPGCILGRRGCGFGHCIFNRVMGPAGGVKLDRICVVLETPKAGRIHERSRCRRKIEKERKKQKREKDEQCLRDGCLQNDQ